MHIYPSHTSNRRFTKKILEEAGIPKSAKAHAKENSASRGKQTGEVTRGKPSVASIPCAVGHYIWENPAQLTYAAAILHSV